jgi:hypothetical protein
MTAACEQMVSPNLDIWFSDDPQHQREAVRICGRCPLRAECLTDAVYAGEWLGVRGGMTPDMRVEWCREQGVPRHGTITGYTGDGCRCGLCREAAAEVKAAWRATPQRWLDAAPLVAAVQGRGLPVERVLGESDRRMFYRARESGRVTEKTADRLLVRAVGRTLSEVYGPDEVAA